MGVLEKVPTHPIRVLLAGFETEPMNLLQILNEGNDMEISLDYLMQDGVASIDGDLLTVADLMGHMDTAQSPEEILMAQEEVDLLDIMQVSQDESESAASDLDSQVNSFLESFNF